MPVQIRLKDVYLERFLGSLLQCLLWSSCSPILQTSKRPISIYTTGSEVFGLSSQCSVFPSDIHGPSQRKSSHGLQPDQSSQSPIVCSGDFKLFNNVRLRTWNHGYFFLLFLSLCQGYQKYNFSTFRISYILSISSPIPTGWPSAPQVCVTRAPTWSS